MPCYKNVPSQIGSSPDWATGPYTTEAECNQACREGACCEGTTCTVKPQCQCQGAGQVFRGVGTVCTPNNPCDTSCKPCNEGTEPSKATVSAVIDNIVLHPNPNNPFTLAQLNGWLAGTYVLNKTDIGNADIVYYQFGGWPVPTGSRYADMNYRCSTGGQSGGGSGPICTVSYNQPGFEIKMSCGPAESTQRGNVCTETPEIAFGNIISNGNFLAGTARMTVS